MSFPIHLGIFDLSSNIHRNYRAVTGGKEPISKSGFMEGIPIFSTKSTLLQLYKEINAAGRVRGQVTHILLVLDSEGDCFRHKIYPEYKVHRPKPEENLLIQKKIIERCVMKLGYRLVKSDGVEADDIIASVAHKCTVNKIIGTIFSRDKDLFSLIDDYVQVYSGADKKFFDPEAVIESKGVVPSKIEDMLVLQGDKADNVLGVKGFGSKGIGTLLANNTLDELLATPELILESKVRGSKRLYGNFVNAIEQISFMRQIVKMKKHISLNQSLKDWKYDRKIVDLDNVITSSVRELLTEHEI